MAIMGELTIQLSSSVRAVFEVKESCFFCSKFSLKCKTNSARVISAIFFIASVVWFILSLVKLADWNMFNFEQHNPYNLAGFKASEFYSWMNIAVFLPLTLVLIYYYACMRSTLD